MIRILVIIILIFSQRLYSQNIVIKELCIDHKKGTPNREAAHSYFDKDQNKLFLTFMNKTTLYLNTYVDLKVKERYEYIREEDPGLFNQVSDAVLKDQKDFYLFFANPTCADFSVIKINLLDKSILHFPELIKLGREELYLYSFSTEGKFYILTSVRRTSKLRIYEYNFSANAFARKEFTISGLKAVDGYGDEYSLLWEAISIDNNRSTIGNDMFKYSKTVNSDSDVDPVVLSKVVKFYPWENHLIITIDGYSNVTNIIDINLETNKFNLDKIEFEKIGASSDEIQKNSFLLEDVLYQAKVSRERLIISAIDFKTKQIIKTFSCSEDDDEINFANSPIRKLSKTEFWGFENANEIKKVKKALRIFSKNNIFIGAKRNYSGIIELTIGSYYIQKNNYYYGGGAMGGMMMGGSSSTEYLYFFKSLITPDYLSNIKGAVGESNYDKLLAKQRDLTCPPKAQVIFKLSDESYFLGYFKEYTQPPSENEFYIPPKEIYYYVEKFGLR